MNGLALLSMQKYIDYLQENLSKFQIPLIS